MADWWLKYSPWLAGLGQLGAIRQPHVWSRQASFFFMELGARAYEAQCNLRTANLLNEWVLTGAVWKSITGSNDINHVVNGEILKSLNRDTASKYEYSKFFILLKSIIHLQTQSEPVSRTPGP